MTKILVAAIVVLVLAAAGLLREAIKAEARANALEIVFAASDSTVRVVRDSLRMLQADADDSIAAVRARVVIAEASAGRTDTVRLAVQDTIVALLPDTLMPIFMRFRLATQATVDSLRSVVKQSRTLVVLWQRKHAVQVQETAVVEGLLVQARALAVAAARARQPSAVSLSLTSGLAVVYSLQDRQLHAGPGATFGIGVRISL